MSRSNSSSAKRIQKELAEISLDPPCNCSAGPKGDNIYEWVSTIMGPSGGCRAGGLGLASIIRSWLCQHDSHPAWCNGMLPEARQSILRGHSNAHDATEHLQHAAQACFRHNRQAQHAGILRVQARHTRAAYSFWTSTSLQSTPSSRQR